MATSEDRHESPVERADRNWAELTQELRVTQTGVQILTAFLLILPFQQRFDEITDGQRMFYLALVSLAIVTTALMVAPVSLHRILFQRGRKARTVQIANRITVVALVFLAFTIMGSVAFVFSVVVDGVSVWISAALTALLLLSLWLVLPWHARVNEPPESEL